MIIVAPSSWFLSIHVTARRAAFREPGLRGSVGISLNEPGRALCAYEKPEQVLSGIEPPAGRLSFPLTVPAALARSSFGLQVIDQQKRDRIG
jgi:hypothetical protein